jgi:hypothetical protein
MGGNGRPRWLRSIAALGLILIAGMAEAAPSRRGEVPETNKAQMPAKAPAPAEVPASARTPPARPPDLAKPPPAAPAATPQAAKPAEPQPSSEPAPDGRNACLRALLAVPGNRVRQPDGKQRPPSDPACQVADPVTVEALAVRNAEGPGSIAFEPPVTVSCALATTLAQWLDDSLQPLARGHFGKDLTSLRVGGGHECRRRNRSTAGPLSEHATGRALDIFAFAAGGERAGGIKVVVEKPEGLVQTRFLQAVRHSACGAFATSLGPGSDAAHANHLHVDIQARRSASTRFCQ